MESTDSQTEGKEARGQSDRERLRDALLQKQKQDKEMAAAMRHAESEQKATRDSVLQKQERQDDMSDAMHDALFLTKIPSPNATWSHGTRLKSHLESLHTHLTNAERDTKQILSTRYLLFSEKEAYAALIRDFVAKDREMFRAGVRKWVDIRFAKEKQTHEAALRQKEVKCRIKKRYRIGVHVHMFTRTRWRCSKRRSRNSAKRGMRGGICTTRTPRTMDCGRTPADRARGNASRVRRRWRRRQRR